MFPLLAAATKRMKQLKHDEHDTEATTNKLLQQYRANS
jgi:hypothetical protein